MGLKKFSLIVVLSLVFFIFANKINGSRKRLREGSNMTTGAVTVDEPRKRARRGIKITPEMAFAMSRHPRLGANSPARVLPRTVLEDILFVAGVDLEITEQDDFEEVMEQLSNHVIVRSLSFLSSPITDNQLEIVLGKTKRSLNGLTIFDCDNLRDFSSIGLCKSLKSLNFSNALITDVQLKEVLEKIGKNLNILSFFDCGMLRDLSFIGFCKNLKSLFFSFSGIFDDRFCRAIFDSHYLRDFSFIGLCKNLNALDLSGTSITDIQLRNILEEIKTNVNTLELRECRNLTDFSSIGLCKNLKSLDLSGTSITDIQLRNILEEIKESINKLDLSSCRNLRDFSFIGLCKNLKSLDLSKTSITDIQLSGILEKIGKSLNELGLYYCYNVNVKELSAWLSSNGYDHIKILSWNLP